jgi:class 3 adenylate cyclase
VTEEELQRKLSAIMFTDIVGYSKMMGADEAGTMAFLKFHNALMREEIAKNGGRVIKTVGDAFLADFNSAVNAVKCAVSVQKRFLRHNQETGKNQQVRIGIHIGDVVISENDIFGDGVNIAARIQPIAEPGGICISQDVYNHIKNKVEFHTVSLGPKELKNIAQKVSIYKIVTEVLDEPKGAQKKPGKASLVPLYIAGLAALGGAGWYFYGLQGGPPKPMASLPPQASPVSSPAPTVSPAPQPPTAAPIAPPVGINKEAKNSHGKAVTMSRSGKKTGTSAHARVFYSGKGMASVWGSDPANTANSKLTTGKNGTAIYHYVTVSSVGCGLWIPPEKGPFVAPGVVDMSQYETLRLIARVPSGLKFVMRIEEAGCDKPGLAAYNGVNGADGEDYESDPMIGTGDWHSYEISHLTQHPFWGNQNGNKVFDQQAIQSVDLFIEENQGEGDIQIKRIEFFNPPGSKGSGGSSPAESKDETSSPPGDNTSQSGEAIPPPP